MEKKHLYLGIILFLFVLNVFCWKEVFKIAGRDYLEVIFFDVGQGDSIFIETPQLHQILIDGGPGTTILSKLGERLAFWDKSLDLVILTHPERDHYAGLLEVLKRYKVGYILWSGVEKTGKEYERILEVLEEQKKRGAKVVIAEKGQIIKAGNLLGEILYPFEKLEAQKVKNLNDTSVVSYFIFGEKSFLFTGDISSSKEKELVNYYQISELKVDILKVAHHGSKYSTSEYFLEKLKPQVAIISCSKDNRYGHPASEVIQRLVDFGAEILRTDEKGDIKLKTNGNNLIFNN